MYDSKENFLKWNFFQNAAFPCYCIVWLPLLKFLGLQVSKNKVEANDGKNKLGSSLKIVSEHGKMYFTEEYYKNWLNCLKCPILRFGCCVWFEGKFSYFKFFLKIFLSPTVLYKSHTIITQNWKTQTLEQLYIDHNLAIILTLY